MVVMGKLSNFADTSRSIGESLEHGANISTILHRNDAELVFFVDPAQESLGSVVENATTSRPVTVKAASLEETIAFFEQEMVFNQLLLVGLGHGGQGIILALEFTSERLESFLCVNLNLVTLFLADTRA